jgi:hypothetical protein
MACRYFRPTSRGQRCIFIGVKEWRIMSEKYLQFCRQGGAGCPILASISLKISSQKNGFLKVGANGLLKEG